MLDLAWDSGPESDSDLDSDIPLAMLRKKSKTSGGLIFFLRNVYNL